VHIPFENDVMILIGENGMGKTQIMNLLYYVLSNNLNKISIKNIDSIKVKFKDNIEHTLDKSTVTTRFTFMDNELIDRNIFIRNVEKSLEKYKILYLPSNRRIDKSVINFSRINKENKSNHSIRKFTDVCNKYLLDKTLIYDENKVNIYVKINLNNQRLHLSDLSFGEKQIISIFSKIYLSSIDSEFIVLIDEPELSQSIFWQRNFLPDIYNSGKVRFLFAVTHSPFIFENELDKYAVSLNEYMKPLTTLQIEQATC